MTLDDTRPPTPEIGSKADDAEAGSGLRGNLGTASLVFTVIAYNGPLICLAGIVPLVIAAGNKAGAPATFLALGILVAIFAVGLNAMASRMSHAGAFYTYVTAGISRAAGLSAGALAVAAYVALCAGTFVLFATSMQHLLQDVFGVGSDIPWAVWAIISWAAVSTLALFNIELSAKILGVASMCEIVVAVAWNFGVYTRGGPEGRSVDVLGSVFAGNPALAAVLAVLCLTGFESLQVFRSETKNASRTVPKATYISVGILTAMYTVSSFALLVAFGASKTVEAVSDDPTGAVLGSIAQYVAKPAADIANILLTTSTLVACLAITNIVARYIFAFAKDGALSNRLAKVNQKHGSPMAATVVAALLHLVVILVILLAGLDAVAGFATLTSFGAYCLILLYVVTSAAILLFFLRRREPGINVIQVYVAPTVAFLGMLFIAYLSTANFADVLGQPQYVANWCMAAIFVLVAGGALVGFWFRKYRPEIYARIGNQSETL
jgi:amino acid transporter